MKKEYITPEIEVMEIRMSGMLCLSGDLEDDANQDALSPDLQDDALVIDINEYL